MSKKKVSQITLNHKEMIRVKNLSFRYDNSADSPLVVKNFSFTFNQNLIYCICGSSGSGKSTLVSHFNGLLKSKMGEIWVRDIYIDPKKRKIKEYKLLRKYVSMVFQFPEYQLFKNTVEKDVMFGPLALGVEKAVAKRNAETSLLKLGLDSSFLNRSPFDLSGGQKRRVAIAGVLAIDADVVIFDEPTAGLDPESENDMLRIVLDERNNGKTIIYISHNIDHILKIADCVLVMKDGELLASGHPYDIFTNETILKESGLYKPYVIKMIDEFVKEDVIFEKLYEFRPNDLSSLAVAVKKVLSHE